ncbi:MAG: amidohydrolase family protein [Planctomycetota bacterium]|nr:amidohydrolase family protein [Planctomycetota bacterium]
MLIDSHHHLWKYSRDQYGWIDDQMAVLKQDFLVPELQQVAAGSEIDGFVAVQARQTLEETQTLLKLAAGEPLIRGVVGWLPLADRMVGDTIDRLASDPLLKGVRHVVQDEPDDQFILGKDFNHGVAQLEGRKLVYDVLIFARQLPASIEFVDSHPTIPMVLDHIAKPTIQVNQFDQAWERHFREIAKRENLTCKFSGVVTEVRAEQWTIDMVRPYWEVALDAFTPKRLMFGSDWPVCLLKSPHKGWLQTVQQLAAELSADEKADLFANTAARVYNLQP